jgi:hypothetical protein
MKMDLKRISPNGKVKGGNTGLGWEFSGKSRLAEQSCLKCKKFVAPDRDMFKQVIINKSGFSHWSEQDEENCVSETSSIEKTFSKLHNKG